MQEVSQTVTDAEGRTTVDAVQQFRAVTLADLLLAVVILLMTIMATRNLPGILQLVLFRRFGLGIVIAFPQHDIHVRSLEEALPVRTRESNAKPSWPAYFC